MPRLILNSWNIRLLLKEVLKIRLKLIFIPGSHCWPCSTLWESGSASLLPCRGSSSVGEGSICRLQMAEPEPSGLSGTEDSSRGQWEGHVDVACGAPTRCADLAERPLLLKSWAPREAPLTAVGGYTNCLVRVAWFLIGNAVGCVSVVLAELQMLLSSLQSAFLLCI